MKQIIELDIPNYTIDSEPDYVAIGVMIDDALKNYFMGKRILLRGVGSAEHELSKEELIQLIQTKGTDRYDPGRNGDRYDNIEDKHIDLFAFPALVTPEILLGQHVIYGFYHSAIGVHGRPTKIDILTVYGAEQFSMVEHQYNGRDDIKRDGFAFRHPAQKHAAVLGVIKIV